MDSFYLHQFLFYLQSACISADFASTSHYTMTRYNNWNWIFTKRIANRTKRFWMTDHLRQLAVTGVLTERDFHRALQHFAMKFGSGKSHIQRQIERMPFPGDVFAQ